jgi:hypothetical protein
MRKGISNSLLVVAVTVCALAAAASGQGDWDPAEHLVPFWESVDLQSRIENPARDPDADPNGLRELTVQAGAELIDYEDLIGIDRFGRSVVAMDQDGQEIYRVDDPLISRSYQATEDALRLAAFGERADEINLSVSIPLEADQGYPSSLSRLDWSMNALVAETFTTVDIPFEASEEWVEVVPGLDVLVEVASATEGNYIYKIKAIYDPNLASFGTLGHWHFWFDEALPATLMVDMEMLNAAGEPVRGPNTSGGFGGGTSSHSTEDGLREATSDGHGRCDACGDVATIRFTFALDAYEVEARLVLEDVPVPGF